MDIVINLGSDCDHQDDNLNLSEGHSQLIPGKLFRIFNNPDYVDRMILFRQIGFYLPATKNSFNPTLN